MYFVDVWVSTEREDNLVLSVKDSVSIDSHIFSPWTYFRYTV